MKYILILLFISINSNNLIAQDCKSIGENVIGKIKKTNYKDIMPYYDAKAKKWGLMNKNGNILTEPLIKSPYDFRANIGDRYYITDYKGCSIHIDYIQMKLVHAEKNKKYSDENALSRSGEYIASNYDPSDYDNLKGFTVKIESSLTLNNGKVTKEGSISKFSKRYNKVENPFYYNDKWYAVATLKNTSQMGIIDQNGEALPNFDFNYTNLKQLDYFKGTSNNEIWYYYEDLSNKKGFINLAVETIMKGELLSECIFYHDYYCIQKNDDESGVIDLRTLQWAIKPQKDIKLQNIIELGDYAIDRSSYYVVAKEGEEQYLVDLNMKKYKPINKKKKQ